MPNATTRQTLSRQWEILKLLPRRGAGITIGELINHLRTLGFAVTERTLQRDLTALAESFTIECNDKGKPYGWRWAEGTTLDVSGLSSAEAVSLYMIEQAVMPLLPKAITNSMAQRFEQARRKLAALDQNKARALAQTTRFVSHGWPLQAPVLNDDVLQTVQEALALSEQLQVHYRSATQLTQTEQTLLTQPQEPKAMRLHPLALINRGPVSYLLATSWNYDDPRLYAVQRIQSAERTHEPARQPADFDLDVWLREQKGQFGSGEHIALQAVVSPHLAASLRETPLSDDQQLQCGTGQLTATVQDTWQLQWWILSQGADIEIKSPPELRERIYSNLRAAAAQYR